VNASKLPYDFMPHRDREDKREEPLKEIPEYTADEF